MDNDETARCPTVHRAFDEATAIPAGDSLLTFAFDLATRTQTHPDPAVRVALVSGPPVPQVSAVSRRPDA
jgi:farnesyl diphosphate synthase